MTAVRRLVAAVALVIAVPTFAGSTAVFAGQGAGEGRTPTVTGPVTAGNGVSLLGPDMSSKGYVREEYFVEGEAANYQPVGALNPNGKWRVEETKTAPFKTRIVVWKPADPADFNGTVFVEWLNVSPGFDNPPEWLNSHNHFVREGATWIGVSAQAASVRGGSRVLREEGAPPPGGLKAADPERYSTLEHPGDAFSYDVFTQAGVAVRGDGDGVNPLEGYDVERVIALGESQSAFRMTTYVNAIHRLARVYEGFLIHSRGGASARFGDEELGEDDPDIPNNVKIRPDLDVPVLVFQTEGDLFGLGYLPARQPDSKNVRLWEVAGTSHADAYLGGLALTDLGDGSAAVALLDPAQASGGRLSCAKPVNANAQYTVLNAALVGIERWVRDGTPPRRWPRITTTGSGDNAAIVRDEQGIARGGIRTPIVEVPLATNDGEVNRGATFCRLFGRTRPYDAATLAELYPNGSSDYVAAFDKAVDKAVQQGIWLEPDAESFKAAARQIAFG
jgi:Alpha/beta hydrolase domain